MPSETGHVFEEAKATFVHGCFVSTVVLASAFCEHWMSAKLSGQGYGEAANRGLKEISKFCRSNDLLDSVILDKVDRLRLTRNPFIHLKSFDHPHTLGQRLFKRGFVHDNVLLEEDAKEALVAMYAVAQYSFRRG